MVKRALLWVFALVLSCGVCSSAALTSTKPITSATGCPTHGTLVNGKTQYSHGLFVGSVATFICDEGYYVSDTCDQNSNSTCLLSSNWSYPQPKCVPKAFGVKFDISKAQFIEKSTDDIIMSCQPSSGIMNTTITSLEIRQKLPKSALWETVVTLNSSNPPYPVSSSDLANKARVSGNFGTSPNLTLAVNESLLTCQDGTQYQCHISYIGNNGQCYGEVNKQLDGNFLPKSVSLEVTSSGTALKSSSQTKPIQLKAGDILELNCTAEIGSDQTTTIDWKATTSFSPNLVPAQPSGPSTQGTATDYHNCQYTRSATVTHTIDTSDASQGNISYSCFVEVFTPDGNTVTVDADNVFHAEIYTTCPRPSSPANGNVHITGTNVNSKAFLTCDQGYTPSTGFTTCINSGRWDIPLTCDPVDCNNLKEPLDGHIVYSNSTTFNNTAEIVCDGGYILVGKMSSICQSDGSWSDTNSTCVPMGCRKLQHLTNGVITLSNSTYVNSTATFSCYYGYTLSGNATSTCQEDGWDTVPPVCSAIECMNPVSPAHGYVSLDNGTTEVNDTVTFSCFAGYHLVGVASTVCLINATWHDPAPSCIVKNCSVPSGPIGGYVDTHSGLTANATATVICNPGYTLNGNNTIVCTENATWSTLYARCLVTQCPATAVIEHGKLITSSGNRLVNNSATVSCDSGYVQQGSSTVKCDRNGTWDMSTAECIQRNCSTPIKPLFGNVKLHNGLSVNSTATVTCDPGFYLNGTEEITCLDSGDWSDNSLACLNIECNFQNPPEHGKINATGSLINDTTFFFCDSGYYLQGSNTSTCLSNGNWSSPTPLCLSIECPKLNLSHGFVVLSNQTFYQSKGQLSCKPGYILHGSNVTECTEYGNWSTPVPHCEPVDCGNWTYANNTWKPFSDVTYSKNTIFGSTAICSCIPGYQIEPSRRSVAAECTANGTWSLPSPPLCVKAECPPLNISMDVMVKYSHGEIRSVDSIATFSCNETGYTISGYEKVKCLDTGEWSGPSPTCTKIEEGVSPCVEDKDFQNTVWNSTQPGIIVTIKCPQGDKYTGEISRECTDKGEWMLPVYNCIRQDIEDIDKQIDAIKENPSEEVVTEALDKLTVITKSSDKGSPLFGGELERVTSILESITDISNKTGVHGNQPESFLKTTSNLLDTSNTESWKSISQQPETTSGTNKQSKQQGAAKILDVVSRYSDAIATLLNKMQKSNKTISAPNLVLHVSKLKQNTEEISFPGPEDKQKYNLTSSFLIPGNSLKGLKHVSSVLYKNLSGILSSATISNGNVEKGKEINSAVVAVQIPNWQNNRKDFHITLKLGHFQDKFSNRRCNFWNETMSAWDGTNCTLNTALSSADESVCECNHLTNFAILMSPWIQENVDTKAIDIISTVGCSVSLLALVLTIAAHVVLWRYVKSDRVILLINLSVALVISYAIFLGGVDRTENKDACTTVAVLLQYIYLVVFFLMLAEGIEIAVTVLYVFSTQSRLKWLLPSAWLIPAVIVGISLGATQLKGYGNEQFCWLSVEGGLIWGFVGPAFAIILVNFVLLILVIGAAFRTATLSQKSRTEKTKTGVKCLCVLLPIMGCTWVIGIFYVNENMAWIQYVFAVCNSLQGLVIFLFHCVLNKQIRTGIERRRKKYKDSLMTTTSTSNNKSFLPRASLKSESLSEAEMSNTFTRDESSFKTQNGRNGSKISRRSSNQMSGKWHDSILEQTEYHTDL